MKKYEIKIKVAISENWIDDGVDFSSLTYKELVEEAIRDIVPSATEGEMTVIVSVKEL